MGDMMTKDTIKVEVKSGIYELLKPVGKLGAKNFAVLSSAVSTSQPEPGANGVMLPSPKDHDKIMNAFMTWTEDILPQILISGPNTYEKMNGNEQWGLFGACLANMDGDASEDVFKIVK